MTEAQKRLILVAEEVKTYTVRKAVGGDPDPAYYLDNIARLIAADPNPFPEQSDG